jgi:plastocyanin
MRRHPLDALLTRSICGVLALALVVGCAAGGPAATAIPPGAVAITISTAPGEALAFEPAETIVRTIRPIALTFRNGSSLPHNVVFTSGLTAASRTIVDPGASDVVLLVPPAPGTFRFVCTIHSGMAGTLIVETASVDAPG